MRRHLTYANVVSTLALCLVVGGGGAYAATQLSKNSVKSRHIAKGAVTSSDIKDRGVTLRDLAADVTGKNGAPGLKGDPGPIGPIGPVGPAGKDGAAGQDLSFDGVKLGRLERYPPELGAEYPLGDAGPADIFGRCSVSNGVTYGSVRVRKDPASTTGGTVYGGTGQYGYGGLGSDYALFAFTQAGPPDTAQWSATIVSSAGAWDVRGIITRQDDGNANPQFPPQGAACAFTQAYVERISRY